MMSEAAMEPEIVQFGPYRVIGMNYVGRNENGEVAALWGGPGGFLSRVGEVEQPGCGCCGGNLAFGLCRCIPGVTDGSFEYVAAVAAAEDAPMPEGMLEAEVAAGAYAAFKVESLADIGKTWEAVGPWQSAHTEWDYYCGPDGCDCTSHPCFELYPPEFDGNGPVYVYIPLKPKQ